MNWRRGLFRLWIVASTLFVLAVAFVSYDEIKKEFEDAASATPEPVTDWAVTKRLEEEQSRNSPGLKPVTDPELIKQLEGKKMPNPWAIIGTWAGIAFGIPLAVLILGSSLVWAFTGFAATRK